MDILESFRPIMRRYEDSYKRSNVEERCTESHEHEEPPYTYEAKIIKDLGFLGTHYEMTPAPDYKPLVQKEVTNNLENQCRTNIIPKELLEWGIEDVRRHGALLNCHEILYFPMIYGRHRFPTEYGRYMWAVRCCKAKPDQSYIAQLRRSILLAADKFWRFQKVTKIQRLVISDSLYCLGWFGPETRRRLIKILGETLSMQDVAWISVENTHLNLEDGIILLLAISAPTWKSLEVLHMWHFFMEGLLPLKEDKNEELYVSEPLDVDEGIRCYFYCSLVLRTTNSLLPQYRFVTLHAAYSSLESLKVLSINYTYLVGGKGESMLYLGCIRSGTLRKLNILLSVSDLINKTKQYICISAWKKAVSWCPLLRVNLVALDFDSFDQLQGILVQYIPLESFFSSTGYKCDNVPLYFESMIHLFTRYHKRFLKRLNFKIVRPRLLVDHIISKFLTELPYLEEFIYRGPLDNIHSFETMFTYIEKNNLRLKKLHVYLNEDPCQPEAYRNSMNDIFNKYESMFIEKNIDFRLGTYKN